MGDADIILDKALERALHIEEVTRIGEEDNEPLVSAIQSNENIQLVILINDLLRTLQSNNLTGKIIKSFHRKERGQKSLCAEVSVVQEKPETETETIIAITEAALIIDEPFATVERNRKTTGGENRSQDLSHESRTEQSKTEVSSEREKCRRWGQRSHASKECKNCFECGSPNHFKRNCPYLNEN